MRIPAIFRSAAAAALLAVLAAAPVIAQSTEERLRELERKVAELAAEVEKARQAAPAESATLAELERRIELVAAELEQLKLGEAAVEADESRHGLGPAASKVYRRERGVSVGGYGEVLYQNFAGARDDGASAGRTDDLDLLRAVLYFGYKWNDDWILNTELEWEHGSTGENGEASVEFAYLDRLIRSEVNLRAGLVLIPMGLLNELHEPTVFLGARRPGIESAILPTTWREIGAGVFGELGGFTYRSYLVNGLDASGFAAAGLRGGRQKGSNAKAEDFAWVGRLDWTATPGLVAGGSAYFGDSGQGLVDPEGGEIGVPTRLLELHADWRWRGLELRALWADAALDDVAGLNRALGLTGNRSVGEALDGHYLQAGYDLLAGRSGAARLVPFGRWETYDTQGEVPAGWSANPASEVEVLTLGLSWQPFAQVVLKADWQDVDNGAGTGVDQFNVALGYVF
ncbi:MAG: hypothetical protein H6Q03_1119 [Acidobacteria bacterium]|nr:hypothetical protein [Acidobacteriota bacterium]